MEVLWEKKLEDTLTNNISYNYFEPLENGNFKVVYEKQHDFEKHFQITEFSREGNIINLNEIRASYYYSQTINDIEHTLYKLEYSYIYTKKIGPTAAVIMDEFQILNENGEFYIEKKTDSENPHIINCTPVSTVFYNDEIYMAIEHECTDFSIIKINLHSNENEKYMWIWQNQAKEFLNKINVNLYVCNRILYMASYEIFNNDKSVVTLYAINKEDFKELYKVNHYEVTNTVDITNNLATVFLTGEENELYLAYSYKNINIYKFVFENLSIKRHFFYSICNRSFNSKILLKNIVNDKQNKQLYIFYVEEYLTDFKDNIVYLDSRILLEKKNIESNTLIQTNEQKYVISNFIIKNGIIYTLGFIKRENCF